MNLSASSATDRVFHIQKNDKNPKPKEVETLKALVSIFSVKIIEKPLIYKSYTLVNECGSFTRGQNKD